MKGLVHTLCDSQEFRDICLYSEYLNHILKKMFLNSSEENQCSSQNLCDDCSIYLFL